jgi:hypothetical protein
MASAESARAGPDGPGDRLWALACHYWRAESELVRRYLRDRRTPAGDLRWLRLQAYKETRLYRELTPVARQTFDRTGELPGQSPAAALRLTEEMRHFELICGLIHELDGAPPTALEVLPFPADVALQAARAALRAGGDPLERAISELVEGGGGAMYEVLRELDGSAFDRRLAQVFAAIHQDELRHGPAERVVLPTLLQTPAALARATTLLHHLCRLRLAMRAEMFGGVVDRIPPVD